MSLLLLLFQGNAGGSPTPTPTPTNAFAGGGGGGHTRTKHYRDVANKIHERHKPDPIWGKLEKSLREQLEPIKETLPIPIVEAPGVEIWDEDEEELLLLGVL